MANFNKAFNFRGGFQVDTDVLIVRGQNVGIGSTNAFTYTLSVDPEKSSYISSTSEIKISVLINKRNVKKALAALHKEFNLDK